jgi:hypothetical protein
MLIARPIAYKTVNNNLHGIFVLVISTVQATCDEGSSGETAQSRSSPVNMSHGTPYASTVP